MTSIPVGNPRRILLIKPSAIGDVVHALPVLSLLRRRHPDAEISWLVTPACAGLLEHHPLLDHVIFFERQRLGQGYRSPGALHELRRFTRSLREREFDLVIDLQGLFRSGWLSWQTGAKLRVGLASAREGAPLFYTHRVQAGERERHAIEKYLDAAEALGLGRGPVEFVFNTTDVHRHAVREKLASLGEKPIAALFPGANWLTKRWPVKHFATLAEKFRAAGFATVVAGAGGDSQLAEGIRPDLNLCGRTTLPETTALLERSALVVANDTGPMHIAAALGRPLVTLFGPTSEIRTGPYARPLTVLRAEMPCAPCLSRRCSHVSCMKWLDPAEVFIAARNAL